jgi:Predicted transcriptional regulator
MKKKTTIPKAKPPLAAPQVSTTWSQASEEAARIEFGTRLDRLIKARGWSQSELSRIVGLGRDSISTYIRGKTKPEPKNLLKICEVLKVKPEDIYPGMLPAHITDTEKPVLEMKQDDKDPSMAWLRVNQKMTLEQAGECLTSIMAIIKGKSTK